MQLGYPGVAETIDVYNDFITRSKKHNEQAIVCALLTIAWSIRRGSR